MSETIRCPFCESAIPREALFCSRCGGKLPRRETAAPRPIVSAAPVTPPPAVSPVGSTMQGAGAAAAPVPATRVASSASAAAPVGSRSAPPPSADPSLAGASQVSLSQFDRSRGAPRVIVMIVGAAVFLAAGFGLARWLGSAPQDVPVVTAVVPSTPDVALGDPRQVVGAEVPDPAFLGGGSGNVPPALPAVPGNDARPVKGRTPPHGGSTPAASGGAHPATPAGPATSAAGAGAGQAAAAGTPAPAGTTPAGGSDPSTTPAPATGGADEPDEPDGPEGQLDTRAVIFVVRHYLPQVRSCYERQLRNEPELHGQVTMRFTIGAGGRVVATEPVLNSTGSEPLAACVAATLRTWHFPEPEGGPVAFEYPFRFGRPAQAPALPGPTETP